MRHQHTAQLRWSDPDMLGHLNHARILSLVEDARMAFLSISPTVSADRGRSPRGVILARIEVDYLRQVRYRVGESLPVETWITKLGTKSLTMRQELSQDGQVALRADAICVAFDYDADRSRPFDDDEREFWAAYQDDKP
ncbi:MAG: acyl-CoA thioesterase [Actinomycetes bacterium]